MVNLLSATDDNSKFNICSLPWTKAITTIINLTHRGQKIGFSLADAKIPSEWVKVIRYIINFTHC
jgi:hypothetical protein